MAFLFFHLLLVSTFVPTAFGVYNLAQDYSGDSFFQDWDFFTGADPTNGHVVYQSQPNAQSQGLVGVQRHRDVNSTKQIYIGVDSTSQTPNGRPSVRITTQKSFQHALVLADIAHQPGGICGVWPALWMVGSQWPEMGEIDIVEGVSTQSTNQMTLHTNAGPILDHKADFTGNLLTSNCDVKAPNQPNNAGCGIADDSNITFGNDFNAIGGGVYATQWTSQFIKIWFFPRNKIPADVQNGSPTPSDLWGTPNSLFQGDFNIDDHFKNLQIVLNTAFCGDWAGQVWSQTPECAALAPTCDDYVGKNPQAFEQAFWLVNSIKVFQEDGRPSAPTSPAPTPSTTRSAIRTITETQTILTTATLDPQPPNISSIDPNAGRPRPRPRPRPQPTGDLRPPGMMFGSPGFNIGKHKRRHGGAVIPSHDHK